MIFICNFLIFFIPKKFPTYNKAFHTHFILKFYVIFLIFHMSPHVELSCYMVFVSTIRTS